MKSKFYKIFVLASTFIFLSCLIISERTYFSDEKRDKLTFLNDSEYVYEYNFGYHHKYSSGKYYLLNKSTIYLESEYHEYNDSLIVPASVLFSNEKEKEGVLISIIDHLAENKLYKYTTIINDTNYTLGNKKKFKISEKIKSITLKVERDSNIVTSIYPLRYSVYSNKIQIPDTSINTFKLNWKVNGEIFFYEPMRDTLIKRGGKLHWENKGIYLKP